MENKGFRRTAIGGCSCGALGLAAIIILPIMLYFSLIAVGGLLIVADPIERVDAVVAQRRGGRPPGSGD
ncbi:MAG: hypothetical protein ACOCYU_01190 [Brevefilum sp.]